MLANEPKETQVTLDAAVAAMAARPLRPGELRVLALLSHGMTNEEIARTLDTSIAIVKWRTSGIFTKLGVRNRVEAISRARQQMGRQWVEGQLPAPGPMPETLTKIEREILRRLNAGLTRREIASALAVKVGTVTWHLQGIFGKLQVRNRVEALMRARQLDYL